MQIVKFFIPGIALIGIGGCRTTSQDSPLNADTINQHIYEVAPLDGTKVTAKSPDLKWVRAAFLTHIEAINARIKKTGYAEDLGSSTCSMGRQLSNYFSTTGPFELRSADELQKIYEDEHKQSTQIPSRKLVITGIEFLTDPKGNVLMSVSTAAYIPGTEDLGSPTNGGQGFGEPVKLDAILSEADQKMTANSGVEVFWANLCSGFNKSIREYGWVSATDQNPVPMENRPLVY